MNFSNKIICLLIIISFNFSGCYVSKAYLLNDLPKEDHNNVVKIVRLSKIVGVMLKDKTVVKFDSKNGEFDENKSIVSGYNIIGEYKEYSSEDINYILLKPTDIGESSFDYQTFIEKRKTKIYSVKDIKEFKAPYWEVISFRKDKLQINSSDNYIEGITKKGSTVKVPFEDIAAVETNKKEKHRLVQLGVSLASIVFIIKEGF